MLAILAWMVRVARACSTKLIGRDEKVMFNFASTILFHCNVPEFLIRIFQQNYARFLDLSGRHVIIDILITYSASIFFIEEPENRTPLCLKLWRTRNDGVYDTTTSGKCVRYIVDGLLFNRRFASDVYLGIASISDRNEKYIVINEFTAKPVIEDVLSSDREYALVMKRLLKEQWLDFLLEHGALDTLPSLKFLALEVARMHKMVEPSSLEEMGSIGSLKEKLRANLTLLDKITCIQDNQKRNKQVADALRRAFERSKQYFEERWLGNHIRHCHGDLKSGNLWLSLDQKQQSRQLLALDCVDFNRPEFCHIDTLCDVAMLAINLELSFILRLGEERGQKLVKYFLDAYLKNACENAEKTWPLLDYYMAEKAVVCAYTSHVYDQLPLNVVDGYLKLALMHAERLNAYSLPNTRNVGQSPRITRELAPI